MSLALNMTCTDSLKSIILRFVGHGANRARTIHQPTMVRAWCVGVSAMFTDSELDILLSLIDSVDVDDFSDSEWETLNTIREKVRTNG